ALPAEAVVEDHDLMASTAPLADQASTGGELRANARPGRPGLLHLHCDLAQLTLRLRAQPTESQFLQAVGACTNQQVAAEMRGSVGFIETAPLLTKLVEIEHREARKRLPAGILVPGRHRRRRAGVSTSPSRYTDWPFWSRLRVTSRPA